MALPNAKTVPLARAQGWFRRYHLLVILPLIAILLFGLFIVRTQNNLLQVLIAPEGGLTPTQSIQLTYNLNVTRRNCRTQVAGLAAEDIVIETRGNIQIVSPRFLWPSDQFTIEVICGTDSIAQTELTLKPAEDLTLQEQAEAQSILDYVVATERKEYLEANEFVDQFPLTRTDYTLRYLEADNVVYVVLKTPATASNREEIRATIRQELNTLGVPEEVPIVFPDEYNQR